MGSRCRAVTVSEGIGTAFLQWPGDYRQPWIGGRIWPHFSGSVGDRLCLRTQGLLGNICSCRRAPAITRNFSQKRRQIAFMSCSTRRKKATNLPSQHSQSRPFTSGAAWAIIAGLSPSVILIAGDVTSAWHRFGPIIEKEAAELALADRLRGYCRLMMGNSRAFAERGACISTPVCSRALPVHHLVFAAHTDQNARVTLLKLAACAQPLLKSGFAK